ncbi:MAG: hypothetical protein R3Y67_02275 [Eubacteriales bacterium]
MKKETKIAVIILGVLVVIMAVALFLNQGAIEENQATFDKVELKILENGEEVAILSYEELILLGAEEFQAVYDTSDSDGVMEQYTGVELRVILESLGISLEDKSTVTLTAVDNYAVAYSASEVAMEGNVYVTFEREGEALLGKEDGGQGPLQTIVVSDSFSNRRCKWLISIGVE